MSADKAPDKGNEHGHGDAHGQGHAHGHGDAHGHGHAHGHDDAHKHNDHGHHGGEEFVPANSLHDFFLQFCAGVTLLGLCWLMYFWALGGVALGEAGHGEGSTIEHGSPIESETLHQAQPGHGE